jgi:hypothetical protein
MIRCVVILAICVLAACPWACGFSHAPIVQAGSATLPAVQVGGVSQPVMQIVTSQPLVQAPVTVIVPSMDRSVLIGASIVGVCILGGVWLHNRKADKRQALAMKARIP